MEEINRRQFVLGVATAAAACYLCGGGNSAEAADTNPPPTVDAGPISGYAQDGVYDTYAKTGRLLIYREGGKIYASTASCTHKKVMLKVVDGQVRCPAHGSRFDNNGAPTKGPAAVPLVRYAVQINADKHLVIDTTKTFDQSKWSDPAASVSAS